MKTVIGRQTNMPESIDPNDVPKELQELRKKIALVITEKIILKK